MDYGEVGNGFSVQTLECFGVSGVGCLLGECWLEQTAVSSASPNTENKESSWIPAPSTAGSG